MLNPELVSKQKHLPVYRSVKKPEKRGKRKPQDGEKYILGDFTKDAGKLVSSKVVCTFRDIKR